MIWKNPKKTKYKIKKKKKVVREVKQEVNEWKKSEWIIIIIKIIL